MLIRKISQKLAEWKGNANHNPLVIKGCRQCGKTYSALQFAEANYDNVVYVNFFEDSRLAAAFDSRLDVDNIVMYISALLGSKARFVPHKTCLILDEIQECPNARTSLKFFKMDGRYDVIATGSLLGISGYREHAVQVPVGYETVLEMHPLDFEEFLWANGIDKSVIDMVKKCVDAAEPVPDVLHGRMRELLMQYVLVGGMPAVVSAYVDTHNLSTVLQMQRDIVNGYRDDMMKYADAADKPRIRECFNSIPAQLSKENKKFQYAKIKVGARSATYAGSLQWIEDAGIINRCHNLSITELPLDGNALADEFKVYMADIGLFISMLEDGTQADVLRGNLYAYKGAIFENLIADVLSKAGRRLYYFRKPSGLEVDFVTRIGGECTLVECKATSGNVKSTRTILQHPEKYHVSHAIKFADGNVGANGGMRTLPLYAAFIVAAAPM